jgi:integrase
VTLSAVLSYAVRINLITDNSVSRVKAPKTTDGGVDYTLSEAQTAALVAHTPKSERALMMFLCFTGSRPSEACEVRFGDINHRDALVIIRRTATNKGANATKNSRVRTVPLVPDLMSAIREQMKVVPHGKNDLVFPTVNGQRHQMQRWATDVLRPSINRAGLAVPEGSDRNYLTRKSFITQMLNRGESIALVSELVGASPATLLKHYTRHRTEDAVAAMQRMSASMATDARDTTSEFAQTA